MTTRYIPKMGQHRPLTPLPDPPKPPDAMQRLPHAARTYVILKDYFRDRTDVLIGGRGYLCYDPNDLKSAPRPDSLVAFDLAIPPKTIIEANGYTINEVGKPPDFVLDVVASESASQRDYNVKRDIYASYGVREQWCFDHTGGRHHDAPLTGDRLVNGEYVPIPVVTGPDGVLRGFSEALGLELHWDRGALRFWEPATKEYLPDLTEAKAQRDAAIIQRDAAVIQRDAEAEARQAAEERLRQLESELRRLQSDT